MAPKPSAAPPKSLKTQLVDQVKRIYNPRGPVGWMLDRQLLTSLRQIFIYDSFGMKVDPRPWMFGREVDRTKDFEGDEFWFDYLSDTGDGMRATYSIAYLAQSDLFAPASAQATDAIAFEASADFPRLLPRGDFLFVGGDTSYHVADFETLTDRFQEPFNYAFRDLARQGRLTEPRRRPLLGIPGNHDYYDFLDGFNRQFRRPYDPEPNFADGDDPDAPQLALEGFARKQWASFVSIKLPFEWRMWGFDAQGGQMDRRQKNFFRSIRKDSEKPTNKLIVATPEPILAFGQRPSKDREIAKTFEALGLPRPTTEVEPREEIPVGSCRLDLAGDVHHYARYGGAKPDASEPACYASVVSGLGGAFLHPSSTDVGEVPSAAKYPTAQTSLREVLTRLLRPWTILRGGRLWLIGILLSGLLFTSAASSESLRSLLGPLLAKVQLELPHLATPAGAKAFGDPIEKALAALRTSLDVHRSIPPTPRDSSDVSAAGPANEASLVWNPLWFLDPELAYLPVVGAALAWGLWRYSKLEKRAAQNEVITKGDLRNPIRLLIVAGLAAVVWVYIWPPCGQYGSFQPLASSLLVLTTLVTSYFAFRWCRAYDRAMNRRSRQVGRLKIGDHLHGWLLWAFTALCALFGIARYGVDSLSVMAVDMSFVVVSLAVLVGLPAFAAAVGGALHGGWGKVGFFLLGLWQACLQLFLPLLLVVSRAPWVGLAAGLATAGFTWALSRAVPLFVRHEDARERNKIGWLLTALWLAWSAAICALVFEAPARQEANFASFVVALLLGAFLSCIWFGWYLAISICFDGHNNEAGGGSRIEDYKQFIRFRLTKDTLTGYVIAVDQVADDGTKLKPRLIDVFELRPRS